MSESSQQLITVSIPVFNEESNIGRLIDRLGKLDDAEPNYRFEFLFTDNASTDRTFERLAELATKDSRIRVLSFSRNFGFQKSILTNFLHAKGAAAVQLDADLQDPPELISQFLRAWEDGFKVVYGVRRSRPEGALLHGTRRFYYRAISWLSETYVPADAGDFRLIDRLIIEQLREVQEQSPYLRGLIANLGYPQRGIPYDRDARVAGDSKFHFFDLLQLALDGITSQSTKPLRLITLVGFGLSFLTFLGSLFYVTVWLTVELPSGFTTLAILMLVSIGLNTFFLGLLGEYVGRIFNNTRGLPISIIERRIEPTDEVDPS